jgi:anti-sigma factor RsiW
MRCDRTLELAEPVAAGDIEVDLELRAHLESCPRCSSALASARRIEAALASRPAPSAPDRFVPAVMQRIRRERWRSEQQVDRLFNVAVAAAIVLIAGGIAALLNVGGVLAGVTGFWDVMSRLSGDVIRQAAPTVNTYIAAAGLLISALGMWWWADRTLSL